MQDGDEDEAREGCPVCGGDRLVLVALPEAGVTGECLCLGCGALWMVA